MVVCFSLQQTAAMATILLCNSLPVHVANHPNKHVYHQHVYHQHHNDFGKIVWHFRSTSPELYICCQSAYADFTVPFAWLIALSIVSTFLLGFK